MESTLLGAIDLDQEAIGGETQRIAQFASNDEYSEYTLGTWKSYTLWNGTGDKDDNTFRDYDGAARKTELGRQLEQINALIERTFAVQRIRWVRAFVVQDGIIVPHRDFIEFDRVFTRVHVPLRTDFTCLHSEEDDVFHMRSGEIWYLGASRVHSACSLSNFKRISICLDFRDIGADFDRIFSDSAAIRRNLAPTMVDRPAIDQEYIDALYSLGTILNEHNYRDVLRLLSKIHFYRRANVAAVYDWMIEIARRSGNAALLDKSIAFRRFCIEQRRFKETFDL